MTTMHAVRPTLTALVLALAWSTAVATAQPAQPVQPAPTAQPAQETSAESRRERTQLPERNVRVTLTLTDQLADAAPVVRTAVMTIADGSQGQIRSSTTIRKVGSSPAGDLLLQPGADDLPLNVDASVNATPSGAVLLRLGFTYFVPGAAQPEGTGFHVTRRGLTENLTVLLKAGQSMVVSESADPVSDRKVKVEVKAEIL